MCGRGGFFDVIVVIAFFKGYCRDGTAWLMRRSGKPFARKGNVGSNPTPDADTFLVKRYGEKEENMPR